MATIDNIPVFYTNTEDPNTGVLRVSLVKNPAVQKNFEKFSAQNVGGKAALYSVADEEKRLVRGVVLRADYPIYRQGKPGERMPAEYYVVFRPDSIRQIAERYLSEGRANNVSLNHEHLNEPKGVNLVQYFIKGNGVDVGEQYADVADGSLFAEYHVVNDDVWQEVKAGTYKGFSVEICYALEPARDQAEVQAIADRNKGLFSNFSNMKKTVKTLLTQLASIAGLFASVDTDKGKLSWDGDDELKPGTRVSLEDADGNRTEAPDGDYATEDGRVIRVSAGAVTEIVDDPAPQQLESIDTDGGELKYEGELVAGTPVFLEDEAGNRTPAADGEYRTEDGRTIVVKDGKVVDVKAAPAPDTHSAEDFAALESRVSELEQTITTAADILEKWMKTPAGLGLHQLFQAGKDKPGDPHMENLMRIIKAK